jgi:hypothetical protein
MNKIVHPNAEIINALEENVTIDETFGTPGCPVASRCCVPKSCVMECKSVRIVNVIMSNVVRI